MHVVLGVAAIEVAQQVGLGDVASFAGLIAFLDGEVALDHQRLGTGLSHVQAIVEGGVVARPAWPSLLACHGDVVKQVQRERRI